MSVPDGELILMVELGLALVLNNGAIELGVVGPGESNNENLNKVRKTPSLDIVILIPTYRVVLHLDPQLGVLLADDGELDPDVAALSSAQQTFLKFKK